MKSYESNPRIISEKELSSLKASLKELGDISGITHNINTGEIISGNQRSEIIDISNAEILIVEKYDTPTPTGTVALGYIIFQGVKMNYRQVDWNKEQSEKACIAANKMGGRFDYKTLAEKFSEIKMSDVGFNNDEIKIINQFKDFANLGHTKEEVDNKEKNDKTTFDSAVRIGDMYIRVTGEWMKDFCKNIQERHSYRKSGILHEIRTKILG